MRLTSAKISSAPVSAVAAVRGTVAAGVILLGDDRGYRLLWLCRLVWIGSSKNATSKNDSGKGKGFSEMHLD